MNHFKKQEQEVVKSFSLDQRDYDVVAEKVKTYDWEKERPGYRWRDWFLEHCGAGIVREVDGYWQICALPDYKLWLERMSHYERRGGKWPSPKKSGAARDFRNAGPVDNPFDFLSNVTDN